jgi:hypothetical protein
MRFSVLRKMLPKLVGLYTWRIQMPPMDGRGGGGWKCGKFIVTNILIDRKKLWLVSHKMRKNRVSKVLRKMRKRTFLGMLPSLRIYATFYAGGGIIAVYTKIWRCIVWLFSNFKRNIFGWKVVEHRPSVFPSPGLLEWNGIHRFQTEYFWLKSGWTQTFGLS